MSLAGTATALMESIPTHARAKQDGMEPIARTTLTIVPVLIVATAVATTASTRTRAHAQQDGME